MTDQDLPAFLEIYRSLERVLIHARLSDGEARSQESAYFKALRKYHLRDVRAAAETLIATSTKFPKPVEWVAAMPARDGSEGRRIMREDEAREYERAVALHYQDEPCGCHECQAAGMALMPRRFVPDDCLAKAVCHGKVVVCGRWIHGHELARWYAARDAFFALYDKIKYKTMDGKTKTAKDKDVA